MAQIPIFVPLFSGVLKGNSCNHLLKFLPCSSNLPSTETAYPPSQTNYLDKLPALL
ncbi:hypothetical protein TOT_020000756 [Theileria orientalis strain Shintoku]|uniref:Uncharacterized protein n=1 Tax=Theileria orientalis strain Shintoku TaxID=869250 RepID=J4C3I5_THEOR|nr:hypothetical protein TOT_020000756 [Theileria orientalis strain Shintoku]BAM40501.1 hypothetical protein TOT_020000756 [Theileria orientalis strain Shintoku]|eukprot:XP_009690802.1 hypothetical protein TOT_020000756 [Theileria orientalis strain Shintoku]